MNFKIQYTKDPAGLEKWELYRETSDFGAALWYFKQLILGTIEGMEVMPCVIITEDDYITTKYQAKPNYAKGKSHYLRNLKESGIPIQDVGEIKLDPWTDLQGLPVKDESMEETT